MVGAGTYAIWANNKAVLMATPNSTALDRWTERGVVALPLPGDHSALSDVGRAMQLPSGWCVASWARAHAVCGHVSPQPHRASSARSLC